MIPPTAQPQATTLPPTANPVHPAAGGKRKKIFNAETPKAHALPDYPLHIELFGTTDCFSTLIVRSSPYG